MMSQERNLIEARHHVVWEPYGYDDRLCTYKPLPGPVYLDAKSPPPPRSGLLAT